MRIKARTLDSRFQGNDENGLLVTICETVKTKKAHDWYLDEICIFFRMCHPGQISGI